MDIRSLPFRPLPFLRRDIERTDLPDGSVLLRSRVPLTTPFPNLPSLFRRNAAEIADQVWIAQRGGDRDAWRTLTYGEARRQVDAVTQALLDLGLPGAPVMVLSGNSIEHAVLAIAAMQARMPYVPVTTAYALRSADHARLRQMVDLVEPGALFVQDADAFAPALASVRDGRPVIAVEGTVEGTVEGRAPGWLAWDTLLATPVTAAVEESVAAIEATDVAKYLFTSGSTGVPKAVTFLQGAVATAAAMTGMVVDKTREDLGTVMLDWLPWSHLAGGSGVFGRILDERGTLYIDDGRPTPDEFGETIRNLREVSPVHFSSMPIGYAMLVDAMDADPELARSYFARLRFATYSGAKLPEDTYRRFQEHAVAQTGFRIPFVSAYGSTETSTGCCYVYWTTERSGLLGLPEPGVEVKLVPVDGERYEVRVRSAAVTAGYLHQPELTAAAFDEEGFYRTGDAATLVDPADPHEGLAFAGRIAEEFKLLSGIFVRVTSLRVAVLDATAPLLRDVVVTGADRAWVGVLAWLNESACRARFGGLADPAATASVRDAVRDALTAYNEAHPASSMRIERVLLMSEPPRLELGEITEKGYLNQRRVLELRAADVEELYADAPSERMLRVRS